LRSRGADHPSIKETSFSREQEKSPSAARRGKLAETLPWTPDAKKWQGKKEKSQRKKEK